MTSAERISSRSLQCKNGTLRLGCQQTPFCSYIVLVTYLPPTPEERSFASLGTRIAAGRTLPAPAPVFPRWIEPEAESGAKPEKPPKKSKEQPKAKP